MTRGRQTALFGLYTLVLAVATSPILLALIDLSRVDETASHLVLIPFVSIVLIYQARASIFDAVQSAWFDGIALLCAGLAMLLLVRGQLPSSAAVDSLSVMVVAVIAMWLGGFLMCFGRPAFRKALFPLLFLAFMIPIPTTILSNAVQFLKSGSADLVAMLFNVTGTPYHRDGFVFTLPNFVIEVADECSGIRSTIALVLTGLLAGHMFLTSWWKRLAVAAAVIPIAILKNGIRIVTLSLLAEHVDPGYLTGRLHHEGGIVFFLLTLGLVFPFFAFLYRSDTKKACS